LGDLNAYAQENPLTTFAPAGYGNLLANTSYSYVTQVATYSLKT